MIEADDADTTSIGNQGSVFTWLRQGRAEPQCHRHGPASPAPAAGRRSCPSSQEALENVSVVGGSVVVQYLVDVQSRLRLFGLTAVDQGEIALPGIGTVGRSAGGEDTPEFCTPSPRRCSRPPSFASTRPRRRARRSIRRAAHRPERVSRRQALFATSKDGTRCRSS